VKKARLLYEQGVQAGERALGSDVFVHDVGHFWGIVETRPYMRARSGLAQTLWALDERAAAIAHFTDMLWLNPGDNQGIRSLLASCLIQTGDDDALGSLLDQYAEDASATWMYTRALWLFRREGAGRKANAALRKALNANPFVPEYLFGVTPLPEYLPPYVGFGDETEAIDYVLEGLIHWHETPGALEWMVDQLERVMPPTLPKCRKRM
jgi:tetratricopeptide (TPR) repeat protein